MTDRLKDRITNPAVFRFVIFRINFDLFSKSGELPVKQTLKLLDKTNHLHHQHHTLLLLTKQSVLVIIKIPTVVLEVVTDV